MNNFTVHAMGIRKSWILIMSMVTLGPLGYCIASISQEKFALEQFIKITFGALACGGSLSFIIILSDLLQTNGFLKKLQKIDFQKIADGNVVLKDVYTGWRREIEFQGTIYGQVFYMGPEFKKGWISTIPYLHIVVNPDTTYNTTELKIGKDLTAEIISKAIDDLIQESAKEHK